MVIPAVENQLGWFEFALSLIEGEEGFLNSLNCLDTSMAGQ
jgi:hypothetical protein